MKVKASVWFLLSSLTVNNASLGAIFAFNRNRFAFEVDIAVAVASVSSGGNYYSIAVICIINCRLNRAEISRAVVIDIDDIPLIESNFNFVIYLISCPANYGIWIYPQFMFLILPYYNGINLMYH